MVELTKFNSDNEEHLKLREKLNLDINIKKYVLAIIYITDNTYVISDNNIYIGMIRINKELNDYYSIDCAIVEEYINKGYGQEVLEKCIELVDNYHKILLRIDRDNEIAIKCALKANFSYDIKEIEKCMEEGTDSLVLSITNEKYKKKTKKA